MENLKKTILVVDDVPENIDILKSILTPEYQVKAALSGELALKIADSAPRPDLILLDVVLPGLSGFETCRQLKEKDSTKTIPVIFVTSRDDPEDESEGFALGGMDYIHKPVNPHIVRARVKTHLDLKAAREDLEKQNEILRDNLRLREEVEMINRHDLKNPLTIILWAPKHLLDSKKFSGSEETLLVKMGEAAHKMLEMINRSVDLYKMETGTYTLKLEPVEVLGLIRQILEAQNKTALLKNLTLNLLLNGEAAADDARFMVKAEELLIYSMLGNLIKNAVEASPTRGKITINLAAGEKPVISVTNQGCIPEAIRSKFMQKFATSGKERGTGLGAYSAKLIATTLGGTIDFTTSEEKGTTLRIVLPS